jgi:hypothetical protein
MNLPERFLLRLTACLSSSLAGLVTTNYRTSRGNKGSDMPIGGSEPFTRKTRNRKSTSYKFGRSSVVQRNPHAVRLNHISKRMTVVVAACGLNSCALYRRNQFGSESHFIRQGYRSKTPGRTGQFNSKGSSRYFPSVMPIPANIMPPQRWHFLALLKISSEI